MRRQSWYCIDVPFSPSNGGWKIRCASQPRAAAARSKQRDCMDDVQEAVIVTYLKAMEQADLETVCSCFTAEATIGSPVYGQVPVRPFYERLFADTVSASVDVQQIYQARAKPGRWAAHFAYKWQRTSGAEVETDLVDLFEFDGDRIASLRIIFDSKPKG
jgi:ketosteroid isomerase-like protein